MAFPGNWNGLENESSDDDLMDLKKVYVEEWGTETYTFDPVIDSDELLSILSILLQAKLYWIVSFIWLVVSSPATSVGLWGARLFNNLPMVVK